LATGCLPKTVRSNEYLSLLDLGTSQPLKYMEKSVTMSPKVIIGSKYLYMLMPAERIAVNSEKFMNRLIVKREASNIPTGRMSLSISGIRYE
jgi:hypothetical protein